MKIAANPAQVLDAVISTMRIASSRGLGGLDPKQLRLLLAVLDAAPELALGGDDQVLIERIGMSDDLDLLPSPGDD